MHPEGLTFEKTPPIYDFLLHSRLPYILLKVKAKEKKICGHREQEEEKGD